MVPKSQMKRLQAQQPSGTKECADGTLWVCCHCGKTSLTKFGFDANGVDVASYGWDAACVLGAVLCKVGGPPWEEV